MPLATQTLTPKVAAEWAAKALAGEADDWQAPSNYIFYQGRNRIVIERCAPNPYGYLSRLTQAELQAHRDRLARANAKHFADGSAHETA